MAVDTLLKLTGASVHYGGVKALDNVSLEIDEGEIVALMGPNGAGKSTVLKAIFGLVALESGKVYFHDNQLTPVPHEMVQMGISFVPQGRRVFKHLTVNENLELGGIIVKSKQDLHRRIGEVYDLFPILKTKQKTKSGNLSGGQQQMLAIARGLMSDPKVLLLDEPTLGLAPKIVKEIFQQVRSINARHKTAVLIVEHNIKTLLGFVDRAYVLNRGQVAAHGFPKDLEHSGILDKVFLGEPL